MHTLGRLLRLTWRHPWACMLSLLMGIVCTALVLVLPGVTMRFVDVVIGQNRPDLILSTAAVGCGAIALRQLLFTLRGYWNNALELKLTHQIRVEVYDKLQRLPVKWFDSNASGETMSRVSSDVPAMDKVIIEGIDQGVTAVLQFAIVLGWMAFQSWELTLVLVAPLPVIGLITAWWSRRSAPLWNATSEANSAMHAVLHDQLAGMRQIKAYTREPQALQTFDAASREVGRRHLGVMKENSIVWPVVSFLAEAGIILMVSFGAWQALEGDQGVTPGTVISFLVAWPFLFDPILKISNLTQTATQGVVAAKRVFTILDTPDETHLTEGLRPAELRGEVRFERVSFAYAEGDSPALQELDLQVKPSQTIALVGSTGAGKSTVLNLLTRFYEPSAGRILLDGNPLSELSKEWLRDHTGFVTQETFLFNTSVRENLLLAKDSASDEELWQVLRAANAEEFIRRSPEGLETVAGERGSRFSGGEKQRLSIARALLKNPPLLLLDEATSALDNRTEVLVQQALDRLRADRTSFVIAHRLSTVRQADLICVLAGGRLIQSGTHADLVNQDGLYRQLCEAALNAETKGQTPGALRA